MGPGEIGEALAKGRDQGAQAPGEAAHARPRGDLAALDPPRLGGDRRPVGAGGMRDAGPLHQPDPMPGAAGPAAEIRVPARESRRIEAAERPEDRRGQGEIGGGGIAARHVNPLRDAAHQIVDRRRRGPRRGGHAHRAGEQRRGRRRHLGAEGREPARIGAAIGVGEDEPGAAGFRGAGVARGIGAGGGAGEEARIRGQGGGRRRGVRVVVDQQDLEGSRAGRLGGERLEQGGDQIPVPEDRHDHRDEGGRARHRAQAAASRARRPGKTP